MRKAISFSVYGNDPKYLVGAIKNAELALKLFPTWQTVFYVSERVPRNVINTLESLNSEVHLMPEPRNSCGMFWRFREVCNQQNSRVIVRDTDSRLCVRDLEATLAWIESGKSLHIIRDHPMHNAPILGGLWGLKPAALPNLKFKLNAYEPKGFYGEDQLFLWEYVHKPLKSDKYVNDEFFYRERTRYSIPSPRQAGEYLGESFLEDESFSQSLRDSLISTRNSRVKLSILRIRSMLKNSLGD